MNLYIVEQARYTTGDVSGTLVSEDGTYLYSHFSSSRGWLERDLTQSFGRAEELAERYPDHTLTYISSDDELPDCLVPFFKAPEGDAS